MKRQQSFQNDKATLYLVSTPIGNMNDMSNRAIDTLKSVDIIFAEDKRNSIHLLSKFNINKPLDTYHEFNKEEKSLEIIEILKLKKNVAIISDAGMPIISDPGYLVSKRAKDEGFNVVTIPGANAALTALVSSTLAPSHFYFYGFLDAKESSRKKELETLKSFKDTIIFYESPHRIKKTLSDLLDVFGDREICLCRELTKLYEEIINGSISEIIEIIDDLKGEMVIVCSGAKEKDLEIDYLALVTDLVNNGEKPTIACGIIASKYGLSKNDLYKKYLSSK